MAFVLIVLFCLAMIMVDSGDMVHRRRVHYKVRV